MADDDNTSCIVCVIFYFLWYVNMLNIDIHCIFIMCIMVFITSFTLDFKFFPTRGYMSMMNRISS